MTRERFQAEPDGSGFPPTGSRRATSTKAADHVVFVDSSAQVRECIKLESCGSHTEVVALTAEALDELDSRRVEHRAAYEFADTSSIASAEKQYNLDSFALAREIESFIADNYAPAQFEGPGFLSGHGYFLQYCVDAVTTRAFLMLEVIRALSPRSVTVFQQDVHPWFETFGYKRDPWIDVVESYSAPYGFFLKIVPLAADDKTADKLEVLSSLPSRLYRYARRRVLRVLGRFNGDSRLKFAPADWSSVKDLLGLRLLMVETLDYDWGPIVAALRSLQGPRIFAVDHNPEHPELWKYLFAPWVREVFTKSKVALDAALPVERLEETSEILAVFDLWKRQRSTPPELNVLGMNLFPAMEPVFQALSCRGPSLLRHADLFAKQALDVARPHAVLFFSVAWLQIVRMAYQARKSGIPVVCFMHGPDIWQVTKNEQMAPMHSDYYLVYGEGYRPGPKTAFPVRATHLPVGSARMERMRFDCLHSSRPAGSIARVLWIGEYSTRNTNCSPVQIEDTKRYALERQCLEILGRSKCVETVFRPYPGAVRWYGTTRWLKRANLSTIRLDVANSMESLLRKTDVVVAITSSPTSWCETMVLNVPLILYYGSPQMPLMPLAEEQLDHACCWCKTGSELVALIEQLADQGKAFVEKLRDANPTPFLTNFVLHRDDGKCVERVFSFFAELFRNSQGMG